MLGTQDKRFDRLIKAIIQSNFIKENDVYVQLGYTKGTYQGIHCQDYYREEELLQQIALADIIITHAGVGSIVSALKLNKKVIVVPRLGKYKEQNNDHQVQIMERFASLGYIIPVIDERTLDDAIENSKTFVPKKYIVEKQGIINEIRTYIKNHT